MAGRGPSSKPISRRQLVVLGSATGVGLLVPSWAVGQGNATKGQESATPAQKDDDEEVSPPEDLMREHGVLKRVLLVYREAMARIDGGRELPPDPLRDAAQVIRSFIEEYHEKLEEDYLFPRFEKAGTLVDLTRVLREQHQAGRRITERVTTLSTARTLKDSGAARQLRELLAQFVRMYEPHEAREDTVLFPALRHVVSKHEFAALGEDFERQEQQRFGEDGFEKMVDRVASIERVFGIADLAQFTPKI